MGKISRISGPVVIAEDLEDIKMYDVVRVGEIGLIGEVIKIEGNRSTIQVYEDTSGIKPGEKVLNENHPLSVTLGPGLLGSIYDGIQRPLDVIREKTGDFIKRGYSASPLNTEKKWDFRALCKAGDEVTEGQILGEVQETGIINHKVMVPFGISGKVTQLKSGNFTINDIIGKIKTEKGEKEIKLSQEWPVRVARKVEKKLAPEVPLLTGQRVIDTFFPVAKGGTVAVPGPFGSGKCVSGKTPVLLGDSSEILIEDLFVQLKKTGVTEYGKDEQIVYLTKPLSLFSMVDGKIVRSTSSVIYRGKSSAMVNVKTESGRGVSVTPIHKLFVEYEGKISEKMAINIRPGDRIMSVGMNGSRERIDISRSEIDSYAKSPLNRMLQETVSGSTNIPLQIFSDVVVEVSVEMGDTYVYDLSVPDYGSNFIGGNGGIVLHNTVVQHQLSKWADSDIVVYVGCGERGNEMTEILTTFPELQDPRSGRPLMERTVLIANTSNMPVAAREASIYTGITIAEYYRDMGYNVALMADSTSRWAEALREISGRLEEMPGEEGYPAYLGRRLSEFYERSGNAIVKSNDERTGSITIVGAVSPPGGDISEPVSQNTLRVTRVFWALDASLASRRHFPSINWLNSYSLYQGDLLKWYSENIAKDWGSIYKESMGILQKESELQEVVQLVGFDALPEKEKSVLDIARMIREDFLQQSAFDDIDQYCSMEKQYGMISLILEMGRQQILALDKGFTMTQISSMPSREKISRMKEVPEDKFKDFQEQLRKEIIGDVAKLTEAQ
ncbi:V-type ATP synthase subunit A [Oxyplasma meridianum]|uniref:A-type ATP synthase subunit A n=1 Tax=Oxyplasma meridianum TaxID=3073602 RepID=A0AAX4NIN6_9ARCH